MFDAICDAIHREMDEMEAKYEKGTQLSPQDLEHIDTMAHAMKNIATYVAMKEGTRKRYREEPRYYTDEYRRY